MRYMGNTNMPYQPKTLIELLLSIILGLFLGFLTTIYLCLYGGVVDE